MASRKQYLLRIDPDVWVEVEKWAADDLRSVNAQVEFLLRDALRKRRGRVTALAEESSRSTRAAETAGGAGTAAADDSAIAPEAPHAPEEDSAS